MNKPVTVAVLQSGLVSPELIREMSRWGLPVTFIEEPQILRSMNDIIECLRDAVEGDDAVKLRDTDLDALRHYLGGQRTAKLMLFDADTNRGVPITITYAVMPNGNYIVPWTDDSYIEQFTDPRTYLKVDGYRITFESVEELFFGGKKAFISAKPSKGSA